jgi:hypothetical protein
VSRGGRLDTSCISFFYCYNKHTGSKYIRSDNLYNHSYKIKIIKKPIVILIILVLIFVAGWVLVEKNNQELSKVDSIYGFSFTPPEGWFFWKGFSALMDSGNVNFISLYSGGSNSKFNITEKQKYITNRKPQDSQVLIFTKSSVDTESYDLNITTRYVNELIKNPLVYDYVILRVTAPPINFNQKEEDSEELELKYTQFLGLDAKIARIKSFSNEYDLVIVNVPLAGELKTLSISTSIPKNDDTISFLEQFMSGLQIK